MRTFMILMFSFVRAITPWILRAVVIAFQLMTLSFISFLRGVPETCETLANDLADRAVRAGVRSIWRSQLYWSIYILGVLMNAVGFIFMCYFTVFLTMLIS